MSSYEKLFNYYYNLQSKEMREEIKGYEPMTMKNTHIAIKLTFKNGSWLHLYQRLNGTVEWY